MSDHVSLDVLAVGAHPDDIEITCGGLLIKLVSMNRKTGALDLTRGEMGTYGDDNIREAEAAKAAKIMGLTFRKNMAMPDSALENNQANRLAIAQVIRNTRPELVILPHWKQRHPDHRICSVTGYDACFLAGLKKAALEGEPFRPRKIIYISYFRNTDYSFLVDISGVFRKKCQAVAAYKSQFADPNGRKTEEMLESLRNLSEIIEAGGKNVFHPGVTIFDLMHTRARQLGQMVGVEYAEAYSVKEYILVDDPQKMPVRSI